MTQHMHSMWNLRIFPSEIGHMSVTCDNQQRYDLLTDGSLAQKWGKAHANYLHFS